MPRTARNGDIRAIVALFGAVPSLINDMDQFFHFETMQSRLSQACAKHNCETLLVKVWLTALKKQSENPQPFAVTVVTNRWLLSGQGQ
jgi:hypothetical protein